MFELDETLIQNGSVATTHRRMYSRGPTTAEIQRWLDAVKPLKVYSYGEVDLPNVQIVQYESRVRLDVLSTFHYQCPNWNGFPIRTFVLANSEFKVPEGKPQSVLVVPLSWQQRLQEKLIRTGTEILTTDNPPTLKTRHTTLELQNFTFYLRSSNQQEACLFYKHLNEISQRVYL